VSEQATVARYRSAGPTADRIAAIIVAFGPDELQINRLIRVLVLECKAVYVMDNGGGCDKIKLSPEIGAAIHIVDMGGNRGIGEALNRGFRLAAAAGFDYVTTFDQDSEPDAGQIGALMRAIEELESTGRNVAAVGPCIVDLRAATRFEHPFMRRTIGWPTATHCAAGSKYVETDFLITSGSVISMAAYLGVGQYDPDLFVDYTDMEWCFRALTRGYRLFGICSVTMSHELSAGLSATALGLTVLGYGPIRRYYYARNAVLLCRRSHVALGWKARLLLGVIGRVLLLPVAVKFSTGWTNDWLMLTRGLMDGIRGISGAYARPA
jgi:rhamnosyltransferase